MGLLPSYILKRPGTPPLWLKEDLFFDGDDYFERVLQDIATAQKLITVEMYIYAADEIGETFFKALGEAAARGVEVRMLLDGIGSHGFIQELQRKDYHPGIKVRVFNPHPLTFHLHFLNFFRGIQTFFKRFVGINRRDHRKIITIDEKISFVGSFNITVNHSKKYNKEKAWYDMAVRLEGWVTPLLILSMMRHWNLRQYFKQLRLIRNKRFVRFNHPDLRLNQTLPLRLMLNRDFLGRLKRSKNRIWICSGYFQPKRRIIRLLKKAAKRGVDVRILLSSRSDIFYYAFLQTYYYEELIKAGVKIFSFDPAFIHAKNYFIDDWVVLGSTNLNYRSFMHDLEVDVRIQHPENKKALDENFQKMESQAVSVDKAYLQNLGWPVRIFTRFIFIFRYWN